MRSGYGDYPPVQPSDRKRPLRITEQKRVVYCIGEMACPFAGAPLSSGNCDANSKSIIMLIRASNGKMSLLFCLAARPSLSVRIWNVIAPPFRPIRANAA